MRTSFAASIFAIAPLLASQAVAAPTANFLGNFFSGIGDKPPVETKIAQTDLPWHFLNIYIFPKRAEDDNVQLRFRFSDDNPNHKISVTCSKEASSEEELFMEKYEPCGDSDVSFRYRGDTIQVWREFDETMYVLFYFFYSFLVFS